MTVAFPAPIARPDIFNEFTPAEVESSIPARFERMVRLFPNHTAVAAAQRYSYAELNRRADLIAQTVLERRGEGNEPVALLLSQDAPAIAAILGVLKAGKIYAALDPAQPVARLRAMLDDLQSQLILTDVEHLPLTAKLAHANEWVLNLNELPERGHPVRACGSADGTSALQLAAIFYTSGSTGEPKGFARDHRTILHRIRLDTNSDRLTAGDRFSLLFQCSYGTSVSDIFDALLNGGTLAMFDPNARGLGELSNWLRAEQITSLHIPVALFRQWLETLGENDFFPALRRLRPAGQLFRGDLERLWPHLPEHAQVFSQLASSETVLVTRTAFTRHSKIDGEVLHVGAPVAETEVFLVNDAGQRVANGEPGRIHVRSRYLSSGYWRRPDLTAEVFLHDPAGGEFRVCKTGDWGRWRADGNLEFLGRQDAMVKVRGHRVELSEIEAALRKLPEVRAAAVTAHDDAQDGKRVIAYVVPAPNSAPTVSALRAALAETLPEHSIPSAFVLLAELPLLPNGKLDGLRLPAPERSRPALDEAFVAPRTPDEATLAAIWSEVLEMDGIGVNDHFLELGGNSLRAMRIIVRAGQAFGVTLSPRLLFDAPTIAQMAPAARAFSPATAQTIPVGRWRTQTPAPPGAPLSSAQQRLWLLDQLRPGDPAYNIARSYRFTGQLNVAALRQSLNAVIARHESLRTTFELHNGAPIQIIHPKREAEIPLIDLNRLPAAEREAEAQRLLPAESERSFDLSRDLLIRLTLLRLSESEHLLLVIKHHISSDGWSQGLFWRELSAHYPAFARGEKLSLPELPVQYADYAAWQHERRQSGALDGQLEFWRRQLADAPPVLELPADRPRPARQSFRGAILPMEFPPDLIAGLKIWLRRENATPFMALLTAFKILLLRYTGQEDLVVGTPTAGRTQRELEGLIGCFLNNLVLRTRLHDAMTVREALGSVRATVADAFANQEIPFEALLETLHPERNASHTPLFQVMFNLLNTPPTISDLGDVKAERALVDNGTTKFDLIFALRETAEGLTGYLEYSTDLFDAATIQRLMEHYRNLLAEMIRQPEARVSELAFLPETEARLVLTDWNATQTDFGAQPSLIQQFDRQAARTPDAVAFLCGERQISFRELKQQADQLAEALRLRGVQPGMIVGVCLERSLKIPVALLAIFKAGGVYLPLDPVYPAERLQFIVEDAKPALILDPAEWDRLQPVHGDENRRQAEVCPTPLGNDLDAPAYIIYTSGSTGRPKGVVVPHRQILNRLAWMWQAYPLQADDVGAQKTAINFVDSLWELLGYLLQGRPTVILPDAVLRDPRALTATLAEHRVTQLWLVPSFLRLLLDNLPDLAKRLPALRCWVSSGEPLPIELLRRFQAAMPHATLYNLYGTSEVWDATWYDPATEAPLDAAVSGFVPIGRPIANVQAYILDRRQNPVPIGVAGELYIGGAGLGDGYLNQPELTAEKFVEWRGHLQSPISNLQSPIPDLQSSISDLKSERLYRTGDLARRLPDGNLELLGRADFQVKLRGFRIELGEIESALHQHPAVRQAAVLVRTEANDARLVAYLVPEAGAERDLAGVTALLKRKLPAYMIPSAFVWLEAMPLTPSGKVDRRALPAPTLQRDTAQTQVAPRDALEWQLAKIWETVLGARPIGVTDNFFDLGGHSLLAVEMFSRIAKLTGQALPVAVLFQTPTIEGLAELLRRHDWKPAWNALVPVQTSGHKPPLFFAPPAGSTVLRFANLTRRLEPDQPIYGLRYLGFEENEQPHHEMTTMAEFYLQEMRKLQPGGPYYLAGICFGSHLMLEVARLLRAQGEDVALLAVLDAHAPTNGPTWDDPMQFRYQSRSRLYYLSRLYAEARSGNLLKLLHGYGQRAWQESLMKFTPWKQRSHQTRKAHDRAENTFNATPHNGRILLIQSAELAARSSVQTRWRSLAMREIEFEIIQGSSHRGVLHQEPYVQQLAATLSRRLNETIAQQNS